MINSIRSLWHSRALLGYLVRADLRVTYGNKVLGYLWSLLDPLMQMVVYVILVQVIFQRGQPLFPVLLFSTLLAWRCFQRSIQEATTCIVGKASLIRTVPFPKIILPTQMVLCNAVHYFLSLVALVAMLLVFRVKFTVQMAWIVPVFGVQLVLTYGICLIVAVFGVYFRDLQNIVQFTLRMVWYLSPGLYSVADRIPKRLQTPYMILNPFAALFETYKNILVRGLPPSGYMAVVAGMAVVSLTLGLWLFAHKERDLAKDV
ncbi:MAG: ABC transporter permease [Candidatus Bipolaricaulis anaerobius]|nr:ABC transporter permease [Candidatus Bipolaricaulis anaerobius]